jgi:hypothetical protein
MKPLTVAGSHQANRQGDRRPSGRWWHARIRDGILNRGHGTPVLGGRLGWTFRTPERRLATTASHSTARLPRRASHANERTRARAPSARLRTAASEDHRLQPRRRHRRHRATGSFVTKDAISPSRRSRPLGVRWGALTYDQAFAWSTRRPCGPWLPTRLSTNARATITSAPPTYCTRPTDPIRPSIGSRPRDLYDTRSATSTEPRPATKGARLGRHQPISSGVTSLASKNPFQKDGWSSPASVDTPDPATSEHDRSRVRMQGTIWTH